jgi:adenylate cyclase
MFLCFGEKSEMAKPVEEIDPQVAEIWRQFLATGEITRERRMRTIFRYLPREPRCKNCNAPFQGLGAPLVRLVYNKRPSKMNPRLCNVCEEFANKYQGGIEVELSLLFADIRGSTTIAEQMSVAEFSRLINRFYKAATEVMIRSDALIDKLIGDEVTGLYIPAYAGPQHARRAIEAALEILRATGHGEQNGPWIPVGAGVHTGIAYVGAVGSSEGVVDITALGDAPNVGARLASQAGPGELLVSEEALRAAGMDGEAFERRMLQLKGRKEAIGVRVMRVGRN